MSMPALKAGVLAAACAFAAAHAQAASPCIEAIHQAELGARLPTAILAAIGMVESGRVDPATGRAAPWPWTINVEGAGYVYPTRSDAVAAVQSFQAAGRTSIDVGCMQVNLLHHPQAFRTLDEAFDPQANATYAAGFLLRLFGQTRDWGAAAAAYHSQTPGLADDYRRRVVAEWPGAARYGVTAGPVRVLAAARPGPPLHPQLTPEFRARLAQDAAADRAMQQSLGLLPAPPRPGPVRRLAARTAARAA